MHITGARMAQQIPCVLSSCVLDHAQTFVARVSDGALLGSLAASMIVQGCGAAAIVVEPHGAAYLVVTCPKVVKASNFGVKLRGMIEQLPGERIVEWVKPLTRRIQRLIGWGDVLDTPSVTFEMLNVARALRGAVDRAVSL